MDITVSGMGNWTTPSWPHPVSVVAVLLLCIGLSALTVRAMIGIAVLDVPGHRSAHKRPIPKGGGVGVMAAFLLGVPMLLWLAGSPRNQAVTIEATTILAAVALLALVSWLDDVRQFRPMVKLAAQVVAATLVVAAAEPLPAHPLLGWAIGLGWLLFVTNALNFIDGLNGLAAGSMLLACIWIGLSAPPGPKTGMALVLAAGLMGFLPFNYPKARIFLGDVGSQGAGLAVGALGLLNWPAALSWSVLTMPLLLAGILYDVGFTLCRRALAGERLSEAHRGHLYQVAFRTGVPAPMVALLHWGFVLWGGGVSVFLEYAPGHAASAITLAILPQLLWTGLVLRRSRTARLGQW